MIDSKILLSEEVVDTSNFFCCGRHYLPAAIVDVNGQRTPAMFTYDQIREAERAASGVLKYDKNITLTAALSMFLSEVRHWLIFI